MLHLYKIHLDEKHVSKMIDLETMKFGVLFVGSSLEFLTNLQKNSSSPLF